MFFTSEAPGRDPESQTPRGLFFVENLLKSMALGNPGEAPGKPLDALGDPWEAHM